MKSQHKSLSKKKVINQRTKQNLQKFILFIIIQQLKELVSNRFGNMKQNQKFGQNLSDGNMAQSVKLDYGSSDFQPNVRKQFMKYAGGQFQATDEPYKPQIILPDTKPIKTQYSLVGELESGFTKLKNNQVQYLKQLRKQFKQIRDLPNTKIKQEQKQKISNSSSHSQSDRNPPNEDDSSSIQSSEKIHKKEINSNQRQQRLWNMQKKQYQYLLNNCQIKIEQLLHNEMQLKKVIHELRSSNLVSKAQPYQAGAKYESQIKQLQKQLREQKQKSYKISNQLQKLKVTNKQINQKYYKLQSESSYKFKDQNKLSDQKRKLQEYLRLEKDKFMNCQIQRRKFQMENQLLTKQKQQEISRIQKQLDHQNAVHELNVKSLIKKFEDQIQLKDRRYNLLISQYQKLKRDHSQTKQKIQTQKHHHHHNQSQNNQNQMFQLMKKLIQQKRNPQNQDLARTINKLIQKLEKQPESDSQSESSSQSSKYQKANHHQEKLLAQIRILKAEIQALKGNSGQGIDLQPMKKMYEAEVAAHKDTIAVLQRKLRDALANKQQSPKPVDKLKPFNRITSQQQIKDLQRRISELEAQRMNMTSKSQNQQLIQKEKKKIQKVQQQLRAQTRKKNEAEFQIFKLRKQLQSRSVIYANEKNYHNNMTQLQLQRANTNIGYWKKEFENMRAFYQQRLRLKNAQLQASLNTTQIENIKKQYADGLQAARQEYQNQTKKLIERLTAYERDYLQYDTLQKRYNALQIAYFQLQRSMVQSRNTSQGVDHLWLIKQTQYGNINQILRQVRMNRQFNLVNPVYSNSGTGASGIIPSLPIIMQNLLGPGYNPRGPSQIPGPSGPNVAGGQIVTYLNNPPLNNSNALNLNSSNAFGGNINPGLNASNPNLLATNVVQQNPPYNSNMPPQNSSYGIPNLNRGSNYGGQSQPLMESQRMSNNFNLLPPPPPPPPPPQINTMIQRNSQDPYQQRLQNNIFESIRDSRNPANLPRISVNSNYIPERMSNTSFA